MFQSVMSGAIYGINGQLITVEADVSNGFPGFTMVGYLASEVKEARERVLTAIKNTGMAIPPKRIVINMSPADIRKQGTVFDLAIALAMAAAMEKLPAKKLEDTLFIGELGLDGSVPGVRGVLALAMLAKEKHIKKVMVPMENKKEAEAVGGIEVIGIASLSEAIAYLKGKEGESMAEKQAAVQDVTGRSLIFGNSHVTYSAKAEEALLDDAVPENAESAGEALPDFSELLGQELLKRAIELSLAGGHHLLISGPPGIGKSMAAKCIPSVLAPLDDEESMEVTKIHSVAGLMSPGGALMRRRPFRTPHHSASAQSIVGGGHVPVPGEVSLAHRGVLFLDELTEFNRRTIEMLRQPLEDGAVTISRVHGNYRFPARFILVAAMNPCPCGYFPDRTRCRCTQKQVKAYLNRVSMPMLDRFDITIEASPVKFKDIRTKATGMSSAQMRSHIEQARRMQKERFKNHLMTNAQMEGEILKKFCRLNSQAEKFIEAIYKKEEMSTRGYCKLLRTARTAADIEGCDTVGERHIYEAAGYRGFDKKYWGNL